MRDLSTKQVVSLINRIERSLPVQDWKIEGIPVWPVVRFKIREELDSIFVWNRNNEVEKLQMHGRGILQMAKTVATNMRDFTYRARPSDVLFLSHTNAKHNQIGGKWFNSYVDPYAKVLSELNITYSVLEYDNKYEYRIPAFTKSKIIQPQILIATLKARWFERKLNISGSSTSSLVKHINKIFQGNGIGHWVVEQDFIKKRISQLIQYESYFLSQLRKYRPQIVFLSNYYGTVEMGMTLACRKFGVPSVDVQHGAQGEYHVAYGNWCRIPDHAYKVIPDLFAVWGEYEKETIEAWADGLSVQCVVTGNSMAHFVSENLGKDPELKKLYDPTKTNVLVTLNHVRGMSEIYEELIKKCDDDTFLWIRAHPSTRAQKRKKLKQKTEKFRNCNFEIATDTLLYQLLPLVDIHITQNSSVTTEAIDFGIPTILTHKSGRDEYIRMLSTDLIYYSSEPDGIINLITELGNRKGEKDPELEHDFKSALLQILEDTTNLVRHRKPVKSK